MMKLKILNYLPKVKSKARANVILFGAVLVVAVVLFMVFRSKNERVTELFEKNSLTQIFEKGGMIMWPLLTVSVLSMGTVIERVSFLMSEKKKRDPKALEKFKAALRAGDVPEAIRISDNSSFYILRFLGYAIAHKERSLENALTYAKEQELKRYRFGIPILDTGITLAPLLGLLGTVTGMMGSFSLIGGELSSAGAVTGGIAEALIATAFGLGIAITGLIPFNILNDHADKANLEMESAAAQTQLLLNSGSRIADPHNLSQSLTRNY